MGLVQLVQVQLLKLQLVDTFWDKAAQMKLVDTKKCDCLNQE